MSSYFAAGGEWEIDENYRPFDAESGDALYPYGDGKATATGPSFQYAVEQRLEAANCYKAVLEAELFTDGPSVAAEVEREVKDFVSQRLSILLGLTQEKPPPPPLPFTPEEVAALKRLAQKVLDQPAVQGVTVKPAQQQETPKTAKVTVGKATPQSAPTPAPAKTEKKETPKQRPGRPKGSKNKPKKGKIVSSSVAPVPMASIEQANAKAAREGQMMLFAEVEEVKETAADRAG